MSTPVWSEVRASMTLERDLFVDGAFVPAASGERFATVDPATGDVLAEVARGADEDVDRAVAAARRSFEAGHWSRADPAERKRVLLAVADLVDAHRDELALMESLDGGKLVRDTHAWDVPGTAAILRWYAEAVDKVYGEVAPTGRSSLALVTREPLGVVGAVVPWNYPLEMAMWKLAPALAAGCSVVLKPAEQTPLSALAFARLCAEAGLPDGVLNVVTGFGAEAGRAIGLHEDVDAVAFTGSTEVGKLFLGYSAQSNLKQVWPECGGKSANLVFADAGDLAAVAARAAAGVFFCTGQVCSANSRLLVQRPVVDELLDLVRREAEALRVGDPLDERTDLGPLVSLEQRTRVLGHVDAARATSRLVTGGGVPAGLPEQGAYVQPTIFADVSPTDPLWAEEVFGPVLAVTPFDTEEEAVELANRSRYGLAASVFTDDLRRAHRVSDALVAGTVTVNGVDAIDVTVPFGGFKQSGYGRDLSLHALDKYTGLKTRWFHL
ncbi:aldehyde dehydrogenase [Nocardioides sp. GY 10127]|uniref:aldehyde dehydrogenase n=1 Tax=Nocardioides sp. GY 10127 TaxID=2569762 RepID=UPI0010A89E4B|nr:aldehyde dehydrogenase [Nocardioides sp. GY 10127]TIC85687.1 aldehyde dehydrogenase [Nocardioides sp. GY 10127]